MKTLTRTIETTETKQLLRTGKRIVFILIILLTITGLIVEFKDLLF